MNTSAAAPQFEDKIVPRADLVFDLLHRGHVTYLAQARALTPQPSPGETGVKTFADH
jgi:bifunctional ADP-heptose synthase (sugar kinase/adenylyltransferase)